MSGRAGFVGGGKRVCHVIMRLDWLSSVGACAMGKRECTEGLRNLPAIWQGPGVRKLRSERRVR